jgi:hypothetical protein
MMDHEQEWRFALTLLEEGPDRFSSWLTVALSSDAALPHEDNWWLGLAEAASERARHAAMQGSRETALAYARSATRIYTLLSLRESEEVISTFM